MTGYWNSQAIYVAAKLGVSDLLVEGPMSCDSLALKTQSHSGSLKRLLRALASTGIYTEVAEDTFALTPVADLLRTGTPYSMYPLAIMYAEEQYRAWGDLLHSIKTGQPAFEHQFGMGVFEYFERNVEAGEIFNEAMTGLTNQIAAAVVQTYDFSSFETIVDVGGGHGKLLSVILQENLSAKGILFDLPHVVSGSDDLLEANKVSDRCTKIGGDFFLEVPAGGDAYLLAAILHDWDDERCEIILRTCRQAIPPSGRLLVVELVLPPGDEPFMGKWLDLHMLVMASGRERYESEYASLFHKAEFRLIRTIITPSGHSILEAEPF